MEAGGDDPPGQRPDDQSREPILKSLHQQGRQVGRRIALDGGMPVGQHRKSRQQREHKEHAVDPRVLPLLLFGVLLQLQVPQRGQRLPHIVKKLLQGKDMLQAVVQILILGYLADP